MVANYQVMLLVVFITSFGLCETVNAREKILVLDFELNDITSLPYTSKELARTASFKPLLEEAINEKNQYEIIQINPEAQKLANAGFGYLFKYTDEAAKLGKQFAADWIIVGQHSKPSFLESYLIADVINVQTSSMVAEIYVVLKGNNIDVTQHAIQTLATKINSVVNNRQDR